MLNQSDCLEKWQAELAAIVTQAGELTSGLTDAQFNWHAAPDRWSIAQIVDHLNIIARLTLPRLEDAISSAPKVSAAKLWKPSFLERMFISMLGPSPKFKSPVPPPFVPGEGGSSVEMMSVFMEMHRRYEACVVRSDGLDIKSIKVASAANKMVKLSLGGWFAATVAHEQYHLGQAKSLRSEPLFPS
jgi:hypothetical protein